MDGQIRDGGEKENKHKGMNCVQGQRISPLRCQHAAGRRSGDGEREVNVHVGGGGRKKGEVSTTIVGRRTVRIPGSNSDDMRYT